MIAKNVAKTIGFALVTAADGTANVTATPDCRVALDDGDFATCANAAVRKIITSGSVDTNCFDLLLPTGEMNADLVTVLITATGCVPVTITMYPESTWTAAKAGYVDASIAGLPTDADVNAACDSAISDAALATATNLAAVKTVIDNIHDTDLPAVKTVVDGIPTTAMRGTDNAALEATLTAIKGASWAAGDTLDAIHEDAGTAAVSAASADGKLPESGLVQRAEPPAVSGIAADTTEILTRLPNATAGEENGLPVLDSALSVKANLWRILGTTLTETSGYLAAAFKKFFNINPANQFTTVAGVDQSADIYPLLPDNFAELAITMTSGEVTAAVDVTTVVDGVLDALLVDHADVGSVGAGIAGASAAADPLLNDPAGYDPGTAGYALQQLASGDGVFPDVVSYPAGNPIEGAKITVHAHADTTCVLAPLQTLWTDALGQYTVRLPVGPYMERTEAEGYGVQKREITTI